MNISIIGTGYVGLVTGICLAETGNNVICVDNDKQKLNSLQNKQLTIFEPGLNILFQRNIKENRLRFISDLEQAVTTSEIIMLALPTPQSEDGSANLSFILNISLEISVFDPVAMQNVQELFGDKINYSKDHYQVLIDTSALIIATEWPAFRTPDFKKMFSLMKEKVIFDGRNVFDLYQMKKMNFIYYSIGRKDIY